MKPQGRVALKLTAPLCALGKTNETSPAELTAGCPLLKTHCSVFSTKTLIVFFFCVSFNCVSKTSNSVDNKTYQKKYVRVSKVIVSQKKEVIVIRIEINV